MRDPLGHVWSRGSLVGERRVPLRYHDWTEFGGPVHEQSRVNGVPTVRYRGMVVAWVILGGAM